MNGTDTHRKPEGEDVFEDLFRHASARERPPPQKEAAIREATHAEWRVIIGRRRRRKVMLSLAAAATVIFAVAVGTISLRGPQTTEPAVQLASVQKVTGNVAFGPPGNGSASSVRAGDILVSGQVVVTTGNARLAVRWLDGSDLRVDQNSEIRLLDSGELELLFGRAYVDSESVTGSFKDMTILTPAGRVRHLGTQYLASVSREGTTVSVRQGRIELSAGGRSVLAGRGEQLVVDAAGQQSRKIIPTYGDLWAWTEALTPPFASGGRTMTDFLQWVSHHSGRIIEYASPEAEAVAGVTVLRGEVDMEPMRALGALLQTSDLVAEVAEGTIVISLQEGGQASQL